MNKNDQKKLLDLIGPSNYILPGHMKRLYEAAVTAGVDGERCCRETDPSEMMEGLYIKVEEDGYVVDRMKYVRASFLQCMNVSETHWLDRPIIPNQLSVPFETLFER